MKNLLILTVIIFLNAARLSAQIPLLINNKPNKEIKAYFEKKSMQFLRDSYNDFISDMLQYFDSTIIKENSDFDKFKVYIIPEAYYTIDIAEWQTSNIDISHYILIDTNVYFSEVYFQKGKKTYIWAQMYYPKRPHYDFRSRVYDPEAPKLPSKVEKYFETRFYKYVLKAHPDNIFTIRGFGGCGRYICFQKGTKVYYFDPICKCVQSLNYITLIGLIPLMRYIVR